MGMVHRGSFFYRRYGLIAALLAAAALIAAPTALAATAALDEYTAQQPTAGSGVAGTEGSSGAGGGSQGVAGTGASGTEAVGGGGGGSLPFTGYPMTTLAWVILGLVLGGIALRLGVDGYRRLRNAAPQIS
jgi:hypothetical protein